MALEHRGQQAFASAERGVHRADGTADPARDPVDRQRGDTVGDDRFGGRRDRTVGDADPASGVGSCRSDRVVECSPAAHAAVDRRPRHSGAPGDLIQGELGDRCSRLPRLGDRGLHNAAVHSCDTRH